MYLIHYYESESKNIWYNTIEKIMGNTLCETDWMIFIVGQDKNLIKGFLSTLKVMK